MKILMLTSRIPFPLEKGDKLRAFHQLRLISEKHEVLLCCLSNGSYKNSDIKELEKYTKKIIVYKLSFLKRIIRLGLNMFKSKPFQVSYFFEKSIQQKVHVMIAAEKPDLIYCQLVRMAEYVKEIPIKKILDYQDVLSKGIQRRIKEASFFLKPLLIAEYKRMILYENEIFNFFDYKTIISEPDRSLIPHKLRNEIRVIPNGVDFSYYQPVKMKKEYDLLFTGNMHYPPNVNAVQYIVKEVIPIITKKNKQIKCVVAGANPHPQVKALERKNIIVTGWVEDLRTYYLKSKIFFAPMQIGTGLQNKLLEAMAMGLPCITSALANSSLHAKVGEEILVGSSPEEYANIIISLLNDEKKRLSLAQKGRAFVKQNFSWESNTQPLLELFSS